MLAAMITSEYPSAARLAAAEARPDHQHTYPEHHHHGCGHEHGEHSGKLITTRLIGSTAVANFAAGVASVVAGAGKTIATTIEGMHNLGDSLSYGAKWLVSKSEQSDGPARWRAAERLRQKASQHLEVIKRLGYAAISVPAGLGALKSGIDLTPLSELAQESTLPSGVKEALEPHKQMNAAAIAASGLSLAWNGGIYATMRYRRRKMPDYKLSANETHFKEHLRYDTTGATVAFAGALMQGGAWHVQSAAAAGLGLYGAWHFRPTKKALEHSHGPNRVTALAQKVFAQALVHAAPVADKVRRLREHLEAAPEGYRSRWRGLALGGLAVAGVAAGAVIWRMNQGVVESGMASVSVGGGPVGSALPPEHISTVPPPEVIPAVPEAVPVTPPAPELVSYTPEASTISAGEGWNLTYRQMGIDARHWPELLNQTGGQLSRMTFVDGTPVAYWQNLNTPSGGEWRLNMSPDGRMPREVLDYITGEAKQLAVR